MSKLKTIGAVAFCLVALCTGASIVIDVTRFVQSQSVVEAPIVTVQPAKPPVVYNGTTWTRRSFEQGLVVVGCMTANKTGTWDRVRPNGAATRKPDQTVGFSSQMAVCQVYDDVTGQWVELANPPGVPKAK